MAKIANNYTSPVSIGGVLIPVGEARDVENWDDIKDGRGIKVWLDKEVISVGGKAEAKQDDGYGDMTRTELDALAEQRGIDVSDAKNKGDVIAALELADGA